MFKYMSILLKDKLGSNDRNPYGSESCTSRVAVIW